jgi:PAS domain S-box-containing protein
MPPRIRLAAGLGETLQTRVGRRVFLLFLLCALLPVTLFGVASYVSLASSLREQAAERTRLTAKRMGTALFERLQDLEQVHRAAASRLGSAARAGTSDARVELDARFAAAAVVSRAGMRALHGEMPVLPRLSERQLAHLRGGGTVVALSPSDGDALLMASLVAEAGPTILWARITREVVDRVLLGEVTASGASTSCVVLARGRLVRCRDGRGMNAATLSSALGASPTGDFRVAGEQAMLGGWFSLFLDAHFASEDLRIVHTVPEAAILSPLARFRRWFLLAGALALLAVGAISIGRIRAYLRPLAALERATARIARREFDEPVIVRSGDEFENLAGAFNDMSHRLRDQFQQSDRLTAELVQRGEELEERQGRLSAILDASPDAIVTVDADGRVESFHGTAERLFARRAGEVVGRPLGELFVGGGVDALSALGGRHGLEARTATARRGDGSAFPAEVTFAEARIGRQTIGTMFLRDISDRTRAAEERERLEAQLRHAQKLETIGTLAGGIAHDFNNILTPIIGHVELALGEDGVDGVREDLEEVRDAALRAKDLVSQILLFSRRSERSFSTVDPSLVVREALKLLRSTLPSTIAIEAHVDAAVPRVMGDATQLHQVVMNLGTNAAHAMRERGGSLEVRLERVTLGAADAAELSVAPGDAVRLTVRDTGHGMDAATRDRLFEPFFTTKAVGEGTGLGMSIVHGIVTQHGGAITVASRVGVGTTFEIHLPAAERAATPESAPAAVVDPTAHARILVVDDDAVVARLVGRILERLGYEAVTTTLPLEVPAMLAGADRAFDLVITDRTMPGMTGIDLAARIAEWRPGFPVVLLSGYSELGGHADAAALGFREVLTKPVSRDVLAAAVARVLAESRQDQSASVG